MADPDGDGGTEGLNERLLDLLVYAPTGLLLSVVEEFPKLAERGRERLGTQVSSARAVGIYAVERGRRKLARTTPVGRRPADGGTPDPAPAPADAPAPTGLRPVPAPTEAPPRTPVTAAHVPGPSELAIPGYDTLSASQVVQRLDGLSRPELVAARAYEGGTRGRRTILHRIDQLLDERA